MEPIKNTTELGHSRPTFVELPVPAHHQVPLILRLHMNRKIQGIPIEEVGKHRPITEIDGVMDLRGGLEPHAADPDRTRPEPAAGS